MTTNKHKSVQRGILWVAIAGIALMFLNLAGYYLVQSRMLKAQKEAERVERGGLVKRLLGMSSEKFNAPVNDISSWDDLYNAVKEGDVPTVGECVGYMPDTYKAGAVAVFDSNGKLIYDSIVRQLPSDIYPFGGSEIASFFRDKNNSQFTLNIGGRLFNYMGAGIVPTDDEFTRVAEPSGYVVLIWELIQSEMQEYCKNLGNFNAAVFTSEADKEEYIESLNGSDCVQSVLKDFGGNTTAHLCFSYPDPSAGLFDDLASMFAFVCVQMLLIIFLMLWYMNRKVTRPLLKISETFRTDSTEPLSSLMDKPDEFGQISKMMMTFFEQREEITMQNDFLFQQKEEIESQNEQMASLNKSLTSINKQMTDSITYASRLQHSMLLAHAPKEGWFDDGFVIYHPKNIVGGDFYMAQAAGDYCLAILGDCTGHGVPGAILASIGMSFVDQIIWAHDFDFMPDTLLNRLRAKVIDAFGADETGKLVNDGMDAAVVIYNKSTGQSYFAGAGRSAVVIRGQEMMVYKGDSMPVGRYMRSDEFSRQEMDLRKGDSVFLYSDGCTDQAGGDQGRKITAGRFKQMLLSLSSQDFGERRQSIEEFISSWRGSKPQSDDISLLAFRV